MIDEKIELKSRRNLMTYFIAFFMTYFLVIASMILLQEQNKLTISMFIIAIVIGTFGIRLFLWLIFGKEIITIENGKLICSKTGTFLTPKKEFEIALIKELRISYSFIEKEQGFEGVKGIVTKMSYRMPYVKIMDVGRLLITLKNKRNYKILNGLNVEEGKKAIDKINRLINGR